MVNVLRILERKSFTSWSYIVFLSLRSAPAQNMPAVELRKMTHFAEELLSAMACWNSSTSYLLNALRLLGRFMLKMTTPSAFFSVEKCGSLVSAELKLKRPIEKPKAYFGRIRAGFDSLKRDACCLRHDEIILFNNYYQS